MSQMELVYTVRCPDCGQEWSEIKPVGTLGRGESIHLTLTILVAHQCPLPIVIERGARPQ